VLSGIGDRSRQTLERTGLLEQIGPRNVLPPDAHPDVAVEQALRRGQELLAELRARPRVLSG
jgi:hypothetical protein